MELITPTQAEKPNGYRIPTKKQGHGENRVSVVYCVKFPYMRTAQKDTFPVWKTPYCACAGSGTKKQGLHSQLDAE